MRLDITSAATIPRRVKASSAIRVRNQASCSPRILRGTCLPTLPGATLPLVHRRSDHFTTLDGATLGTSAILRTLSPASSRAIARSRMSIERGFVMKTGLHAQPPS
jgi:hypothetical protein